MTVSYKKVTITNLVTMKEQRNLPDCNCYNELKKRILVLNYSTYILPLDTRYVTIADIIIFWAAQSKGPPPNKLIIVNGTKVKVIKRLQILVVDLEVEYECISNYNIYKIHRIYL